MRDFLLFVENKDRFAVGFFRQFRIEETPSRVLIITPTLEQKRWVLEYIRARLSDYGKEIQVRSHEEERGQSENFIKDGLLSSYRFDNFVVGKSNQLAYKVCLEVSKNPGVYSPLFIYGGVGLGKTHLLHAIGNGAKSNGFKALYRPALEFSEEMIKSLRDGKIEGFRKSYASVDILLLDDVQFLSGKERTQVELFRVFEALQSAEKQIVLVSDRHPKDIKDISERLLSRFASGLIIEIGLDEETKLSIVKHKLLLFGLPTDKRHIDYVMENTGYSVREIEGFIKTLKVAGVKDPTAQVARKEEDLIRHVAKYFNLKQEDLKRETKERKVLKARQIAMYFCRTLLHMSYSEVARLFGRSDHTFALYSIRKVEEKKSQDRKFAYMLEMLEKNLRKILG